MINLHLGQGTEIYFRDNAIRPTIDEYHRICSLKTGGLFKLSIKLLLEFCENRLIDENCKGMIINLSEEFGKFYQIRDDYLNIFYGDASDLKEGKFTLPTLFSDLKTAKYETPQERQEIIRKMKGIEADKFCSRILSEMATEMETFIFEIEQGALKKNEMKEIIYSLMEIKE